MNAVTRTFVLATIAVPIVIYGLMPHTACAVSPCPASRAPHKGFTTLSPPTQLRECRRLGLTKHLQFDFLVSGGGIDPAEGRDIGQPSPREGASSPPARLWLGIYRRVARVAISRMAAAALTTSSSNAAAAVSRCERRSGGRRGYSGRVRSCRQRGFLSSRDPAASTSQPPESLRERLRRRPRRRWQPRRFPRPALRRSPLAQPLRRRALRWWWRFGLRYELVRGARSARRLPSCVARVPRPRR